MRTRRWFMTHTPVLCATWPAFAAGIEAQPAGPDGVSTLGDFPRQDAAAVRETVAVSHGNLARVRELVGARPALAKAAWDWGFGDWESALGAAAHTGNREIAAYLIDHGARPTPFSAAMLGQLDVVRAFVAATPGVQRTPGPHGITLLAHAKAGNATAVVDYLVAVGDADIGPRRVPLSSADRRAYLGTYAWGSGTNERVMVTERNDALWIEPAGADTRGLIHLGDHAFHPAGAEAVRVRFTVTGGRATGVTVYDPAPIVTAARVGD